MAVVRYAKEIDDELAAHLKSFLKQLATWRELARQRPLAEVIWTIFDQTGYLAFCHGLHDGAQRYANLLHLHERAKQFGTFARQGLYRFLQFLESLQEQTETARPTVGGQTQNAVRIMSIHGSKGLEFPIVFVCDLGKKHNLADCYENILVDRKAYVGLAVVDQERQIRYPSLAQVVVQERLQRQSLAEELRLLYVAMTRAKEHLILIGTAREDAAEIWTRRWSDFKGPLSADTILSGRSLLDWVGPV